MTPATDSRTPTVPARPPSVDILYRRPAVPDPRPDLRRQLPAVLVGLCVVAGVGLRAYAFARNPSLWIDEAMLALNVLGRSPGELLEPLDMNQGAPVGFLLLSKLVVSWLGGGEYALRLIPFAASLAGVALFVPFAYRVLPLIAARYAVALFALSPYLAGYAAEFKQYELDATIAVGLLALGRRTWAGPVGRGRVVALAAAGAAAVWFSHPAAFVLGGIGIAVLGDAIARRDRAGLTGRGLVVTAWAASFAACYLLVTRKLGLNPYLLDYWAGTFLPLPPMAPGDLAWVVHHYFDLFRNPGGLGGGDFGLAGVAGLCFLVGCVALAGEDRRLLAAVTVPLLLCLLASGLRKYPFAGRLLLFAVPLLLLGVARGVAVLADRLGGWRPGAGLLAVGVVFAGPAAECYHLLKRPLHAEDIRAATARLRTEWQDGDRLYVYSGAVPAFRYYEAAAPFPAGAVVFGAENRHDPRGFREELAAVRGCRRVWVLLGHGKPADEAAIRAYLGAVGTGDVVLRRADAVLLLFDLSEAASRER